VNGGGDALAAAVREHLAAERERLAADGIGTRSGPGRRAALLVVDLVRAFTEPDSPLGSDLDAVVTRSAELVEAARAAGAPVFFSVPLAEAGGWSRKIPANDLLVPGTPAVELDPRLHHLPGDSILVKKYASCFFGTDLLSRLVSNGCDTLLIAGCTTSGCVRGTAVDAVQNGFRPVVVAEAVGDRSEAAHKQSLFDLQAKYCDVVELAEALDYLKALQARPS